jgi:hypothetical protein
VAVTTVLNWGVAFWVFCTNAVYLALPLGSAMISEYIIVEYSPTEVIKGLHCLGPPENRQLLFASLGALKV